MLLHLELFGMGTTGRGVDRRPFRMVGLVTLSATGHCFPPGRHSSLCLAAWRQVLGRTVRRHGLVGRLAVPPGERTRRGDRGPPPSIIASAKNHPLAQSH